MPAESLPGKHDIVTRALQNHFADHEKKVAVLDARTGPVLFRKRSTKRTFVEPHFNTYETVSGQRNTDLEATWSANETWVLQRIREVSPDNCTEEHVAAVAACFAMHLVRNPANRAAHIGIVDQVRRELVSLGV